VRRVIVLLLLVITASQAALAAGAPATSCVQECADDCSGGPASEACPPMCMHCPCCFVLQIFPCERVPSAPPVADAVAIATAPGDFPAWIHEYEIFHVPKSC
jgi:hypothetical protein